MNEQVFEIVVMILKVLLFAIGAFLVPYIKQLIVANTTEKQRKEAEYWTKIAVRIAEDVYKKQGQGKLKKEYVTQWLNSHGVKIDKEQLSKLIDIVVVEFNAQGWDKVLTEENK